MRTEASPDGTAVKIYGDYSPYPVVAMLDVVDYLGGVEKAFHYIKDQAARNLLPRMGSERRPLTLRDMEILTWNQAVGHRLWRWIDIQRGNEMFWGYARREGTVEVFTDGTRVQL